MKINVVNKYEKTEGYIDKSVPIRIVSIGNYELSGNVTMPVTRPKGRLDYQFIYIASGKAHFYFQKDKETVARAGSLILYRPKQFQKYSFCGGDNVNAYWIHFTGKDIKALLSTFPYTNVNPIINVGLNSEYVVLLNKIILELQLNKLDADDMAILLFRQLLIEFHRSLYQNDHKHLVISPEVEASILYFREHYNEPLVIDEYAKKCNQSPSTLLRSFKKHTGETPLQFLIKLRLDTAKNLLKSTTCTVNEISEMVGYDNPLYFSRLFSKHVGISPQKYRSL